MSLSPIGTLDQTPIANVVLELIRTGQSGILEVVNGKLKKQLAFSSGRPVAIHSNALSESLGRLLESTGRATAARIGELRDTAREQNRPLEAVLVDAGVVTAEELQRLQTALNQLRLAGLYLWNEGSYRFTPQPVPAGPDLPIPAAILQMARKRAENGSLAGVLASRLNERPRFTQNPPFAAAEFGLSGESARFYASLNGTRSIQELLTADGSSIEDKSVLLYALTLGGLIEVAPAAATAIPIAPPPPVLVGQPAGASGAIPVAPPPPVAARPVRAERAVGVPGNPGSPAMTRPLEAAVAVTGRPVAERAAEAPPVVAGRAVVGRPVTERAADAPPVVVGTPVVGRPVAERAADAPPVVMGMPVSSPPPANEPPRVPGAQPQEPVYAYPVSAMRDRAVEDRSAGTFQIEASSEVGRYVIGQSNIEVRRTDVEEVKGLSIDDMIAQEIGELAPELEVARKVDQDPLLDFDMSSFPSHHRDLANRFKEEFVSMHTRNYFELFGVDRRAKAADIRKAYFNLAKEYHTDRLVTLPEPVQKLGTEIFNLIQRAYDTLTDSELREKYVAATFYGKAGEEEAAIEEVQIVLQADQHYKTGIGLLNAGNLSGAHVAFTRARDLYPKEAEYNACYGYTLFKMSYPGQPEKYEEGEKLIHDALRQNPKLDRANLFLGRIYVARENYDLAGKYYVRALKINPTNLEAGRELQQLKVRREQKDTGVLNSFLGKFKRS